MRSAIRPAHTKGTFHELGGFTDSGWVDSDDVLALSEEAPEFVREYRPVFSDTLNLSENLLLAGNFALLSDDTLKFRELVNPQLSGKILSLSRATVAPATATLTTGFGQGGFGQLGFGGSADINA